MGNAAPSIDAGMIGQRGDGVNRGVRFYMDIQDKRDETDWFWNADSGQGSSFDSPLGTYVGWGWWFNRLVMSG